MRQIVSSVFFIAVLLSVVPAWAQAPDSPRYRAAVAASEFLEGEAPAKEFARLTHFPTGYKLGRKPAVPPPYPR